MGGCVGSSFPCEGFLQLRRVGATLHRGARASHCRGLSRCGAQAPDAQAQQPWLTGSVAPRHAGSSRTRARTRVPCIGRQTLNHCATREALLVVLMCIFLLANDVKQFFMCLFVICISSSMSFESSLYILYTSSLPNICFAKIFSQSVTFLFILLLVSFKEQKFLIMVKSWLRHLCLTLGHKDLFLCFLLDVLYFKPYI